MKKWNQFRRIEKEAATKKTDTKRSRNFIVRLVSKVNSIQTKLILVFLVPVLLIVSLGVITYSVASKGLYENYENSTLSTMNYMGKYLNFGLNTVSLKADTIMNHSLTLNYYSGLSKFDQDKETEDFKEIRSNAANEVSLVDYITNMYILSQYGKGFSASGMSASPQDFNDFMEAGEGALLKNGQEDRIWVGNHPFLDNLSGGNNTVYGLSLIQYFYDIMNNPVGCIIFDVSYEYIMDTLSDSGFPDESAIAFITNDGREIVSGAIPEGFQFTKQSYYRNIIADKESEGSEYVTINGVEYLLTYSKLTDSSCIICSIVPKSLIIEKADDVKEITMLVVLVACIIAIGLGTFIAKGFSSTIYKVNEVLHKVETGDLTVLTAVKRKDEFHILGKSINDVIHAMQLLIRKMSGTSKTVSLSSDVVSETADILVNATNNITEAVKDINNGVTQQAEDAESCLHQMTDLSDKINHLYISSNNIEIIAEKTGSIVDSGMDIIDNLSMKVKDTNDVTKTVIYDIEGLEKELKAISSIITTINGITEQTNLLSLDASIEAARAGELGRGFAVVATEIRKLADQSMKSSSEIANIIKKIEDQTGKTVNTAKKAEGIVRSQSNALSETVKIFSDITKHVSDLMDNLNQIASDAEGIEYAKNDTLKMIENISATTQETAAATEELNVIAINQLEEVQKLNDVVHQLKDDAISLAEEVNVFKID